MTFTIAEDIKTLLTNNFAIDNQFNVRNGDFETGTFKYWTVSDTTNTTISTVQKHGGTYSCLMSSTSQTIEQTVNIAVDDLTAASYWRYITTAGNGGATNSNINWVYTDDTTGSLSQNGDNLDAWVEVDFLASLTAGKTIKTIRLVNIFNTEIYLDDLVFTITTTDPDIRLLDNDPPSSYPAGGEIVIGKEQFLRTDLYNGFRSETFLVDITVNYEDTSAIAPTVIKLILAEMDRVFDAESLTHNTYYYKIRYDWLGSYRIGVVKLQVEVLNALAVRPSLA